jgi:hypothetical protein
MIICCSRCDEFIGICEPIANWTVERIATCSMCLQKQLGKATTDFLNDSVADLLAENADRDELPPRESFRRWRA